MAGPYTKKQLTEVEDSAPKFGHGEVQEARFANADLELEGTGLSHHRLAAGRRQPFAHRHAEAEEVYVILAGSGRVKLDDELVDVAALDAIRVAPEVTRAFEAGEEGLEFIAVSALAKGDAEMVEGWWDE
jgi:mannose-6-phosphate isomerase-like protein (cupin superfamily)